MSHDRPLQKSGPSAHEASANDRAPKKRPQAKSKGVLDRIAREPQEIVWLARAGRFQQAAMRCMVASAVCLAFAIGWLALVPGAGLFEMVLLVPPSADPAGSSWLLDAIMIIGLVPSLLAYLIVPAGSLPGVVFGYMSLSRGERPMLRGIGCIVGNVLVTGVWVFAGMVLVAMLRG